MGSKIGLYSGWGKGLTQAQLLGAKASKGLGGTTDEEYQRLRLQRLQQTIDQATTAEERKVAMHALDEETKRQGITKGAAEIEDIPAKRLAAQLEISQKILSLTGAELENQLKQRRIEEPAARDKELWNMAVWYSQHSIDPKTQMPESTITSLEKQYGMIPDAKPSTYKVEVDKRKTKDGKSIYIFTDESGNKSMKIQGSTTIINMPPDWKGVLDEILGGMGEEYDVELTGATFAGARFKFEKISNQAANAVLKEFDVRADEKLGEIVKVKTKNQMLDMLADAEGDIAYDIENILKPELEELGLKDNEIRKHISDAKSQMLNVVKEERLRIQKLEDQKPIISVFGDKETIAAKRAEKMPEWVTPGMEKAMTNWQEKDKLEGVRWQDSVKNWYNTAFSGVNAENTPDHDEAAEIWRKLWYGEI